MKEFWKYFWENIKNVVNDITSKDKERRRKQIPNLLTLIRGVFAPITIIPAVVTGHIYVAFALIAICSLTDSFDGWYARNYNAQSEFGALLDAICDKLFVLTLALPLAIVHTKWVIATLVLELIIAVVNSTSKLNGIDAHSSILGKVKTVVLDSSIALCYLDFIKPIHDPILGVTSILTNVMQVLCIIDYVTIYGTQKIKNIREKRQSEVR